jgi:hypothetical protein
MKVVIALCGRAGSGKTSVAKHLEKQYGAKRIGFADPLKKMAKDIFGFTDEQVYGEADVKETVDPRWGISPRQAMQKLGQAARDHLANCVWISHAFMRMGRKNEDGFYVIEDLRYRDEALMLRNNGFDVWRLHCEDSISTDAGTHPSEAEVDLIPDDHVTAELRSSRQQGLTHLFGLVDKEMQQKLK